MATYNGERFIHEQLASIVGQLSSDDEIIVVDDVSSDRTLAIVENFRDPRIRIVQQERNSGVIKTFNRALEAASGDIVFLADQDDIWRADKVSKIKEKFLASPEVSLVLSDSFIIDADGNVTAESRFKTTKFHPGAVRNFIRNQYLGCAMAFRRSILRHCLPFPADIPMHDMWIGIVNQLVGKTEFIDEPLMSYRRHDSNASPQSHASLAQMIRWRWALGKNLALLWVRTLVKVKNGLPMSRLCA
jgi:glycosyltransferase involved in cell wall biosynthesis